jgi:hypothetical protein
MADVTISNSLWKQLVEVANRHRRKPAAVAESALREYLERLADERLMADTMHAARRAPFRIGDTEDLIRQHRRGKARKSRNGSPKAANSGRS